MSAGKSARLSIREIAELSLFCALMVAGKECLRLIPNVHPVTLLLLLATAVYGAKALYPAFGFALLEIALYGAGIWNLMYLYVWPLAVLVALPFRQSRSRAPSAGSCDPASVIHFQPAKKGAFLARKRSLFVYKISLTACSAADPGRCP